MSDTIDAADYVALAAKQKKSKYGNVKVVRVWNGKEITLDSMAEGRRFDELVLMEQQGEITSLVVHLPYDIEVYGEFICTYEADFFYVDAETGMAVIEDVKGVKTVSYRLKKKLMKAIYNIDIQEIKA